MIVFPFFCSDSSIAGVDEVHSEKCRLRLMPFVTTFIVVHDQSCACVQTGVLHSSNYSLPIACSVTSIKIGKRSNAHAYNLRNSEDLNLPECRTAAAQRGFFYRAPKARNSLNNNSRTAQ